MKKKLVAMLLALVMVACAFPVSAFADYSPSSAMATSGSSEPLIFYDYKGRDYEGNTAQKNIAFPSEIW